MSRSRLFLTVAPFVVLVVCSGCGMGPGDGPFGAPVASPRLAPFAGTWVFEFDKTLEAQKAAGTSEKDVERLRKLYASNPMLGKMHPDITIEGNQVLCAGFPAGEYWLFGMHEHDGAVCGKAWHHEDRHDPGDMSKCYVRLRFKDDHLHFETRMKDGNPDLNDADLRSPSATDLDSSAQCDADSPAGEEWSEWSVFVFSRKR